MHNSAAVNWILSFILICWLVDQLISSNIFLTKYFLRKATEEKMFSHPDAIVAEQVPHVLDDKVFLCLQHLTRLAGISLE